MDEIPKEDSGFKRANRRLVELIGEIGGEPTDHGVDYFFYAPTFDHAADLMSELKTMGYKEVNIYKPENESRDWSVIGYIEEMKIDENTTMDWVEEMEQLAEKYTCKFDGWGTVASD